MARPSLWRRAGRSWLPLRPVVAAASAAAMAEQPRGPPAEPPGEETEPEPGAQGAGCARPRAVEPVLLLATLAMGLQGPLCTQYLWERLGPGNGTGEARQRAGGGCANGSGAAQQQQEELESLVAHWNLYLNLAGFLVGLFSVTLLGPWSDAAGRRPALVLPSLGMALQAAIFLAVMSLRLPVAWLLLGRILSGLSGDYNLILAASFAYAADVSDRRGRTFRVAVLEACLGLAGMGASILGGQWRHAQGYVAPFWLVLAASLAAALYATLFLRESVTPGQPARLLTFCHYAAVARLYAPGARGWEWRKLVLYSLAFFLVVTVHFGASDLLVLYELSAPLCWDSELIGYGSAARYLAYLASLLGLRLLQTCLEDSWVAEAGLLSNVLGLGTIALAASTPLMFTGYGLLFLSMTVTPVIRSKLSRLVDEKEQGALFAAVACVEGLCSLVATGVFNSLYPASLSFMKGFPFLFGAVILLVPAAIIGWIETRDSKPDYSHFADVPGPLQEAEQQ